MEDKIRNMVRDEFRKLLTGDFKIPDAAIEDAVRDTLATGAPIIGQDKTAYNPSAGVKRIIVRALQKAYPG